jgi:hypothetical protein
VGAAVGAGSSGEGVALGSIASVVGLGIGGTVAVASTTVGDTAGASPAANVALAMEVWMMSGVPPSTVGAASASPPGVDVTSGAT